MRNRNYHSCSLCIYLSISIISFLCPWLKIWSSCETSAEFQCDCLISKSRTDVMRLGIAHLACNEQRKRLSNWSLGWHCRKLLCSLRLRLSTTRFSFWRLFSLWIVALLFFTLPLRSFIFSAPPEPVSPSCLWNTRKISRGHIFVWKKVMETNFLNSDVLFMSLGCKCSASIKTCKLVSFFLLLIYLFFALLWRGFLGLPSVWRVAGQIWADDFEVMCGVWLIPQLVESSRGVLMLDRGSWLLCYEEDFFPEVLL